MSLKILWHSAAPWGKTGYANQTGLFGPRIAKQLGHEVVFSATWGLNGAPMSHQGHVVLPGGYDPHGQDVVASHARRVGADCILTLNDAWVMAPECFDGIPRVALSPVDYSPMPAPVLEVLRNTYQPVAISRYGLREMESAGLDARYIPHGVDALNVFTPGDQAEARASLGIPPDVFLVGMVAVNRGGLPSRKAWPEQLAAVAKLMRKHDDVFLYLHTDSGMGGENGGLPLPAILQYHGVSDQRVRWIDQYAYATGQVTDAMMRKRYVACDLISNVGMGEGFGIPAIEAQACGTPTVSAGWCAAEELCFSPWIVPKETAHPYWNHVAEAFQFFPNPDVIAEHLEAAYSLRQDSARWEQLRAHVRTKALEYDVETVLERDWRPVLSEIEARLGGRQPKFSEVA